MVETESKRHHYVPEMIQKRFVDADEVLHVYRKDDDKFFSAYPKNAFVVGRLNTSVDRDGQYDDGLERFFSQLEGIIDPFIERVVASVRENRVPDIDAVEKENWDGFVYYLVKRTPDFHDRIITRPDLERRLAEIRVELQTLMPHRSDEINDLIEKTDIAALLRNARVEAVGRLGEPVMQSLSKRGLMILRIDPRIKARFVIGSAPVARLEPGGLNNPAGEWWLPVAPDVAIGITPNAGQVRLLPTSDTRLVRHLNVAVVGQSTSFGSHSPTLLRSLAYQR